MLMMRTLDRALHTKKILCHNFFLQDYCMNFFHHYGASELRLTIVDQKQVRSAGCIKTQPQN